MMPPALFVLVIQNSGALGADTTIVEGGLVIIRASGAALGYEMARAKRPDLIAVDVSLHDGWVVCRLFKRDPLTSSIPVVVVNAPDTPETAAHAKYVGASAVFTELTSAQQWLSAVQETVAATNAA